jgi:1,4-alpha-glucan branching enzyme
MKTKRKTAGAPPAAPAPDARRRVFLDVHLGDAREAYVAGTFNDWHPRALPLVDRGGGRWEGELLLPPGVYEYLFVADGRWLPDPGAPESVPNPYGGENSVLRIP